MNKPTIEVLLIEKDPTDVARVKEILLLQRDIEKNFHLQVVKNIEEAKDILKQMSLDVMLMDLAEGNESQLAEFEVLHEMAPHTPIIILTSSHDVDIATQAMSLGAQDYLIKSSLESGLLTRSLVHAIERDHLIQRLERSLRAEIDERKRMDLLKDEFISTVSHELRTPLAIVKSAIENMRDGIAGELNEKQARTILIAARNLDRLTTIINDLLDLSRLESGKMVLNRHRVNFSLVVQELFQSYQMQARSKNIRLVADLPSAIPDIYADPDMVMQVLNNLMNNAFRYTKTKVVLKARQQISTEKRRDGEEFKQTGYIEISVSDDGEGIAEQDMEKLFNKFQQINRPTGGAGYKGTGLGLAICREIITQHEGTIWAQSDVGKGTTFSFTLAEYQSESDFWPTMTATFDRARLNREALTVIAISIENIRDLKKTRTDAEVNQIYQQIQTKLKTDALRKGDTLFHYSLKEFIAIVAHTGRNGSLIIKERVNKVLDHLFREELGVHLEFRFHVGAAVYPEDGKTPEDILNLAMKNADGMALTTT